MTYDNDGPADERCETCDRLDPAACPCEPPSRPRAEWIEVGVKTDETADALIDVADERVRQVAKWGVQSWPDGTSGEAAWIAEAAKEATDRAAANGTLTWRHILDEEVAEAKAETYPAALRTELVQVAAVALAWVEDIDRKGASS